MERISKMWRSGLALVLALCMVIGVLPATAFAAESDSDVIKYVSVGDSMTNGYGFVGYNQDGHKPGYDWLGDVGVYGDDAYPNLFASYLEEQGYEVEHTKLALSAMRVENLPWLLGITDEQPYDGDNGFISYTRLPSATREAIVRERFQTAFKEADIISLAMGNASFNNFFNWRLFKIFKVFGEDYTASEPEVDLEDALALVESESDKQVIRNVHDTLRSYLSDAIPEEIAEPFKIEEICDLFAYITASYCVNMKIVLEWIGENCRPGTEVILMGIQNTYNDMTLSFDGVAGMENFAPVDLSAAMYAVFELVSAHVSTLPAVMQAKGECEDVTFYFVDAPSDPALIATLVPGLAEAGWPDDYDGIEGSIVTKKTRDAYDSMIGPMVAGMLSAIPDAALRADANNIIYEGLEIAIAKSMESMDINLGALGTFFNGLDTVFTGAPSSTINTYVEHVVRAQQHHDPSADPVGARAAAVQAFADFFSSERLLPLVRLFTLNKVGNGIAAHPTPATHAGIADDMIAAYAGKHTVQEETKENIQLVLGELKEFLKVYGPDVAEDVKALWIENGYQAMVDEYIAELIALVEARYNNYNNEVLPALGETVTALTAQKDALNAELAVLKAQLEVKKAELEKVLAENPVPEISAPDLSIDAEIGNNEQTKVPENDCEGAGNTADELAAAVADLEHAIAVIEALVADVTADIDDMVALATEIAESVASLKKTLTDMIAAAQALKNAVDAVAEVLTNDSAKATVETFINAFNVAREAALTAADGLEVLVEAASEDAAAIEAAAGILDSGISELLVKLEGDEDAFLMILINNVPEEEMMIGGAAMLIIKEILKSEDAQNAIEAKKAELKAELEAKLAEVEAEFSAKIEEAAAALEAKKAELEPVLKAEFEKKYAELEAQAKVEIAELEAAAAEKLAALEAELAAKKAELEALPENAADAVRAAIQVQIDRVTGDIATVKADLVCATEHVNAALKAAYDALVIEITNIYNEAIAELQKAYDELVAAYEAAVKELQDAHDAAIEELNKTVDSILEKIGATIENVKNALIQKGIDSIEALVNAVVTLVNDILYQATHADLELDANSTYVGLGDSTAAADGYIELLAATLKAEFDIKGHTNYAAAGNTAGTELANIGSYEELAGAELITIGFSNVTLLSNAFGNALSEEGASYDWSELVGAELAPYAEEAMASVYAEIANMGLDAETTEMLGSVIEGIAYGAVEYAVKLPQLIYAIRAVNEDAVIAIVGQYNPMEDVVLKLGDAALNVSEYLDYFVNGIAAHGIAFAVVTGEAIFVEASEVETTNTDMNGPSLTWSRC